MYQSHTQQTQKYLQQKLPTNNILVAVRIRPFNLKELQISDFQTVEILNSKAIVLLDPGNQFQPEDIFRRNRSKQMQYAFDFTFDKFIPNKQVYQKTASFLIQGVIDGFNATVFTYGATGCGKTYTMVGTTQNPGIMPLCMADLLKKVQDYRISKQVQIKVSYLEIYNQTIKDLLISDNRNFQLRQDPKLGVVITGITQVPIHNIVEIYSLLKVGNRNRAKETTGANQSSSRSHGILQAIIYTKQKNQGLSTEIKISKLSLVDLAGSERAANTTNRGIRMVQGAKINQSLLILGNCIQALSDMTQKGLKKSFVPYRGSKLTRFLKDSLGGNCRTVMVANISPAISSFQDTYNTLMYANRTKNIKTNAQRNVLNVDNHIGEYASIITSLKKQNEDLKYQFSKNQNEINKLSVRPGIAQSNQLMLIEKLQTKINSDYQEQLNLLKKIYENQEQIQNIGFHITKLMIQAEKQKELNKEANQNEVIKQKIQNSKALVQTFVEQKEKAQKQMNNKLQKRNGFINQIKCSDLHITNQNYLLTLIKQCQISYEKQQLIYKQKKIQNQSKQKQILINYLKNQLSLRDQIIEQQKIILQKNNIINTITYSKLKDLNQISTQGKLLFPHIIQRVQSLPPLKKQSFIRNKIQKTQSIDKFDKFDKIDKFEKYKSEWLQSPKKKKQIKLQLQNSPIYKKPYYHVNIQKSLNRYKLQKSEKSLENSYDKNLYKKQKKKIAYIYPQRLERRQSLPETQNIKKRQSFPETQKKKRVYYNGLDRFERYKYPQKLQIIERNRYQQPFQMVERYRYPYQIQRSPGRSLVHISSKKKSNGKIQEFQAKYDQLMAKVLDR